MLLPSVPFPIVATVSSVPPIPKHDVEARNGRRRSHLGPVWFEAWTTSLAKIVVWELPENLMKSA